MIFKLEIPVTPLVKQWLTKKYGESPVLSTKNALGNCLIYMINKNSTQHDHQIKLSSFPERIVVRLNADVFFRYGHTLTPTSVCHFNKYILEEIYAMLFYGIDLECRIIPSRMIKDCIENFCTTHELNDDVFSYERAKKAYFRYRKSRNTVVIGK